MIIDTEIEVKISNRNVEYYENLGYELPRWKDTRGDIRVPQGTTLLVKVEELEPQSSIKVKVECDYCGKKYEMKYFNYVNSVISGEIKKVACKGKCSQKKLEESNISRYGVKTPCQREEIDKKMKNTMIERYGVEYAAQNKEINDKIIKKKLLSIVEVYNRFKEKGLLPLFYPSHYNNVFGELSFVCPKHGDKIQYITLELLGKSPTGCRYCGEELKSGENHYLWQGGTSPLTFYVRSYLNDWKAKSIKKFDYKCALSGDKIDVVHHLHGFNLILQETLDNLGFEIYTDISKYTLEEKNTIVDECLRLHDKYGLGVPLSKEIHNLFHNLYGRGNNTPEQFEEFKQRYYNGEFDKQLNKL